MALEGLIAQHLRAWIAYRDTSCQLYYWRTRSGSEVDFVVYGPDTFQAIEVKRSARVQRKDVRALRAFLEDYPQARACLLYLGKRPLAIDGIPCLPCESFLEGLKPDQPILTTPGRSTP